MRLPKGAEILRYARKLRGWTQAESAVCYGIEERTLRRWENNEFNPKWIDVVGLVEDVYALDLAQLLFGIKANQGSN
ncbi:multiprotein-bridging factor 1 family protein [Pseudoalteromonas fenneropenaei]|uniref:Multiprotein-bridging factor 1 family protein n=1 Tax=Pseudoalteromonas fenneropenaei TaxID=1737459 RepID=A0ABV7CK64_9GAMM